MRLKWTIKAMSFIALSALLLAGCVGLPKGQDKAGIQDIEATKSKLPALSDEEYAKKIGVYQIELQNEFKKLGDTSKNDGKIDEAWLEQNTAQVNQVKAVITKYRELVPPASYKEIDSMYMQAMEKFDKGLDMFDTGFKKSDNKMVAESIHLLTEAQDLWNYAFANLTLKTDVVMGDGTITSKDLKELDLKAGIDRDSVLLNLSKDSKKLVGKWGYRNDKGQVSVNIVLNADGTYEGYGNNKYPDKGNAFFGTWKYEYLTHSLVINNDKLFVDGTENKDGFRKQMKFDVQAFGTGELQLMDAESLKTFRYAKEGSTAPKEK